MYKELTKVEKTDDGREVIACVACGTERCQLHNGVQSCSTCPMFAAILNQLHFFEEIIKEK